MFMSLMDVSNEEEATLRERISMIHLGQINPSINLRLSRILIVDDEQYNI